MGQLVYVSEVAGDAETVGFGDVLAPSIFLLGDAAALDEFAADARIARLSVHSVRPLESVFAADIGVLGDIVVVDCPSPTAAQLAALIRLDERAARAGAQLVVFTSVTALEDIFGCLERADAQFLVDPTPAQRVLALGTAVARLPRSRVRELDESDRLALLRLTEEVSRLAAKLDALALPPGADRPAALTGRLASPGRDFIAEPEREMMRRPRAPLPDPRLVHLIIRQRRLRDRFFGGELFADPAWDILLDLTAARAEHRRVSVTSLCIASAVPATTALRWITQMTEMGILVREQDEEDRRRAFLALSDKAADAMARYFDELGKDAAKAI